MKRIRLGVEPTDKVKRKDIQFDFRDVQTKNPRLQGKTPLYLFTADPITKYRKPKKRWYD